MNSNRLPLLVQAPELFCSNLSYQSWTPSTVLSIQMYEVRSLVMTVFFCCCTLFTFQISPALISVTFLTLSSQNPRMVGHHLPTMTVVDTHPATVWLIMLKAAANAVCKLKVSVVCCFLFLSIVLRSSLHTLRSYNKSFILM